MHILVIEDNPKLAAAIQQGLAEQGYEVDVALRGAEGEELASEQPYDALILDVMLPDRNGVEVCRELRRRGLGTPILVLSALANTDQKITGLDAGADDYLTKPFEFDELLARVRALLRRGQATESTRLSCADLELDLRAAHASSATARASSSRRRSSRCSSSSCATRSACSRARRSPRRCGT